jgi:hypothetical protein
MGLCAIHLPPNVTAEIETYSFGNLVVYRAETIGATINLLRCYLVWRCYQGSFVKRPSISAPPLVVDDASLNACGELNLFFKLECRYAHQRFLSMSLFAHEKTHVESGIQTSCTDELLVRCQITSWKIYRSGTQLKISQASVSDSCIL